MEFLKSLTRTTNRSPNAEKTRATILGTFTGSDVVVVRRSVINAAETARYLPATDFAKSIFIPKYYF
jgi:hypothetical protein